MLINFVLCWLWLQLFYLGPRQLCNWRKGCSSSSSSGSVEKAEKASNVQRTIRQLYKELGPMNFHEVGVLFCFFILIALWFFRQPQFMPGWGSVFNTT